MGLNPNSYCQNFNLMENTNIKESELIMKVEEGTNLLARANNSRALAILSVTPIFFQRVYFLPKELFDFKKQELLQKFNLMKLTRKYNIL